MTINKELLSSFLLRIPNSEPSILTLAGTGPNGSSQLPILMQIGRKNIGELLQVNVISGSSISYFIFMAMTEGGFKSDGFRDYDRLVRKLHNGTPLRLLKHLLTGIKKAPYFQNELLRETLEIFFVKSFMDRALRTFDQNVRFYAHCLNEGKVVEIRSDNYPEMTVEEICRACISIPALHGPFLYRNQLFVDPTFTDRFVALRRRLFQSSYNHLYLNVKRDAQSRNVIFLKNEDLAFPVLTMLIDFLCLCMGVPNRRIQRMHLMNLQNYKLGLAPDFSAETPPNNI
jgi:hypothetical protein